MTQPKQKLKALYPVYGLPSSSHYGYYEDPGEMVSDEIKPVVARVEMCDVTSEAV